MANHAFRVLLGLIIALVEVVEGKGAAIWCLCHFIIQFMIINGSIIVLATPTPTLPLCHPGSWQQQIEWIDDLKQILFSNLNVMYQKNSHNNRRNKQTFFPTPQTRIEERNTLFDQNEICLEHSNPLELICLNCDSKLLCSQCIQSPSHSSHEFKSIQRAKQMIYSQYQQWMIRLHSKSEILDIIHVQFQANKSEISSFSKQYKQRLESEFGEIISYFKGKLEELSRSIDVFIRQYIFQMSNNMERIRSKRKDIEKIVSKYEKERIEAVPLPELANYSYEIRGKINELLDQNDLAGYKERLIEPEWRINQDIFKDIRSKIDALSINFKDVHQKSSFIEDEKPKKKSKKDLKISEYDRERSENKLKNSCSSTPFVQTTLTPKNKSKEKKMKLKKSPEAELLKKRKKSSAKMISMPASPAKEVESTYLITPEMSRKKLFKKK